jgi:NAD(P)-dependent dehydrogenase (short-subunit alcohol dehydrogenase family)
MNKKRSHSSFQKTLGWAATGVGVFLVTSALIKEITKYNLAGKVILITGGSRGLGLALARQLAARGAKLAICARSADKLELIRQELEQLGTEVIAMPVDVTERDQVDTMINDIITRYGRLDVLINNAGIVQIDPELTLSTEDYEQAMQTNFWAPLYTIHAALPHFREQGEGKIVNITSVGARTNIPRKLSEKEKKFVAVGLSEALVKELKKDNIDVVTVMPDLLPTGVPKNITVRKNYDVEYAWFKLANASPGLEKRVEAEAQKIIRVLEYGHSEPVLSLSGKLATIVKRIAPPWVNAMIVVTDKFLPGAATGSQSKQNIPVQLPQTPQGLLPEKSQVKNNKR